MCDMALILSLVKMRLNRLASDTTLDEYLTAVIGAAAEYLTGMGIHLDGGDRDNFLLVNQAVQMYQQRDQGGNDPEWLRYQRRQRWLMEGRENDDP